MSYSTIKNLALKKFAILLTSIALIALFISPAVIQAKPGIFLNSSVYFTLDSAFISSTSDAQTLRFTLELNNNSNQVVNFNKYGVRIMDKSGHSYSVQLSEMSTSLAQPNQVQNYKFVASLPADLAVDQIDVNIFLWDFNAASYMRNIGSLPITAAIATSDTLAKQQLVLDLHDADSSIVAQTLVSFEVIAAIRRDTVT